MRLLLILKIGIGDIVKKATKNVNTEEDCITCKN